MRVISYTHVYNFACVLPGCQMHLSYLIITVLHYTHTATPLSIAHTHRMYKGVHTCMYESIHAHTHANMAHIHEHAYIHVHTDMQVCIHHTAYTCAHMDTRHSPSCTNPVPLITQTHVDAYIHKTSHICMHVPTLTQPPTHTQYRHTQTHILHMCMHTHTHYTCTTCAHTHMYTHTTPCTFTNHISH